MENVVLPDEDGPAIMTKRAFFLAAILSRYLSNLLFLKGFLYQNQVGHIPFAILSFRAPTVSRSIRLPHSGVWTD